jgi:hypothetical protein
MTAFLVVVLMLFLALLTVADLLPMITEPREPAGSPHTGPIDRVREWARQGHVALTVRSHGLPMHRG